MNEVRRRDLQVFFREAFSVGRLLLIAIVVAVTTTFGGYEQGAILTATIILHLIFSYRASIKKRFHNAKMRSLWQSCQDRLERFRRANTKSAKAGKAKLEDLPHNIERIAKNVYQALRRADLVLHEVTQSEGWLVSQGTSNQRASEDLQAQELFRLADKNIAEYRQNFQGVIGGVQRTEAQAAVFVTTLDNLRLRLLSQRLVGQQATENSQEFLEDITEAKMQLDSIDKALEELELTPFPKTVSVIPDDPREHLETAEQTPPEVPEEVLRRARERNES
jgi:hypothetical protein